MRVGHNSIVPQTCGVGVLGIFRKDTGLPTAYSTIKETKNAGGAGWCIVSFTDCPTFKNDYKKAYEELKDKWKIVMQSPVRTNKRTGRKFFFVIYDSRARTFKTNNLEYEYPLDI